MGLRWRRGRVAPIVDSDGISRTASILSKDITASKEMEDSLRKAKEEAESSNKAKSEFLSHMSHEFRTPLNAILGYAQILESGNFSQLSPEQKECVEEIMEAGNHLLVLINEVLDLARIESGKIRMNPEPLNLTGIVHDCLRLIEPLSKAKEVELHHETSGFETMEVYADRTRLKEILINVLSNAMKYNKDHGSVTVRYEEDDAGIKVHISDTGIGISAEELSNVFDSFYRIKDGDFTMEGTGIGLSVTKQLIELMGGSIEVESVLNEGSRFTLVLPPAQNFKDAEAEK